jgi:hypothetical protein
MSRKKSRRRAHLTHTLKSPELAGEEILLLDAVMMIVSGRKNLRSPPRAVNSDASNHARWFVLTGPFRFI